MNYALAPGAENAAAAEGALDLALEQAASTQGPIGVAVAQVHALAAVAHQLAALREVVADLGTYLDTIAAAARGA